LDENLLEFKLMLGDEKMRLAIAPQVEQFIGLATSAIVRHASKSPQVAQ
jgi:hypothetical protein